MFTVYFACSTHVILILFGFASWRMPRHLFIWVSENSWYWYWEKQIFFFLFWIFYLMKMKTNFWQKRKILCLDWVPRFIWIVSSLSFQHWENMEKSVGAWMMLMAKCFSVEYILRFSLYRFFLDNIYIEIYSRGKSCGWKLPRQVSHRVYSSNRLTIEKTWNSH